MGDIIGIDLGGTKLNIGLVSDGYLVRQQVYGFSAHESADNTLNFIERCIAEFWNDRVIGIGIGVPSIVDLPQGIVFDAVNIPSWKKVHLRAELERRFGVFVYVNNDVNCFVAGEKHYGKGRYYHNIAGVCLGTGFGVGLYLDNRLYAGKNCGAGELGSVPYLDSSLDTYCSGKFFTRNYDVPGEVISNKAAQGDAAAREYLAEFGRHLGHGLATVLLAFDPEILILGGSVAKSYDFFIDAVKATLTGFPYPKTIETLVLERSELEHAAVLGVAALCREAMPVPVAVLNNS